MQIVHTDGTVEHVARLPLGQCSFKVAVHTVLVTFINCLLLCMDQESWRNPWRRKLVVNLLPLRLRDSSTS